MVHWFHAIISAYGFWLPNDPRGSWSDFVYAWELFRYGGPATTVTEKRSHAHDPHDREHRREMKRHLKFPPARFDEACRESIAKGFACACKEFDFPIHAAAIDFDHVHLVTGRDPNRTVENVVAILKARATRQMNLDGTNPMRSFATSNIVSGVATAPTPWGKKCWSVFIDNEIQLGAAIRYVQRHPMKEGLPAQNWDFVRTV